MQEFIYFFKEGFFHVLDWKAYDHVLFFIVLIAAYAFRDWKRVLLLVTCFTIGHTISLFLAAYKVVSVNATYIEFLIPITILCTAIFNLVTAKNTYVNDRRGMLLVATGFFGIIHGFGFSSYFKMINSAWSSKALAILEFAFGIEVSQILVVIVVVFISYCGQTFLGWTKRDWILITSSIVIGMVLPMILESEIW